MGNPQILSFRHEGPGKNLRFQKNIGRSETRRKNIVATIDALHMISKIIAETCITSYLAGKKKFETTTTAKKYEKHDKYVEYVNYVKTEIMGALTFSKKFVEKYTKNADIIRKFENIYRRLQCSVSVNNK